MDRGKIQLKGLKGVYDLSNQDYEAWRLKQIRAGKLSKWADRRQADRLYRNQQFVNKYGEKVFKSMDYRQRDAFDRQNIERENAQIIQQSIDKAFNPVREDGNIDPNKGVGDINTFYEIMNMDPIFQKELYESGWVPENILSERLKKASESKTKEKLDFQKKHPVISGMMEAGGYNLGTDLWAQQNLVDPIESTMTKGKNKAIYDKIKAKDIEAKSKRAIPLVNEEKKQVQNLNSKDANSEFINAIFPNEQNIGIPQLAAFYNKDGSTRSSEVDNIGTEEKKQWIAKKRAYEKLYGIQTAASMLDAEAKAYLDDNQSFLEYTWALGKDMAIGASSYAADRTINGIKSLYLSGLDDYDGKKFPAWVANGNIVGAEHVIPAHIDTTTGKTVPAMYKDPYTGKLIPAKKGAFSRAALDAVGIDYNDGKTRSAIFNNKYWSDAEATGMWSRGEQAKAMALNGYSPSKPVYRLGEDTDYLWETIKMSQFAAVDVASTVLPTKVFSLLGAGAKTLNTVGKIVQYANGAASAIGIGNAYKRGVDAELIQSNLLQVDNAIRSEAAELFHNNYTKDSTFKGKVDAEVNRKVQETLSKYGDINVVKSNIGEGALEELRKQAYQQVAEEYTNLYQNKAKNDPAYMNKVQKAYELATEAGTTMAVTDALKYAMVNFALHRSFLFKNKYNAAPPGVKGFKPTASGRIEAAAKNELLGASKKSKAWFITKTAGSQMWGGAWTNYTDELQSAGSKQINEDKMGQYLKGDYKAKGRTIVDDVLSYFEGAKNVIAAPNSIKAGIVGGLGSVFSLAVKPNALGLLKKGSAERQEWVNAKSWGERVNIIFSNGILDTYYDKLRTERQREEVAAKVNKVLDDNDDFSILSDAVSLDLAAKESTNPNDKKAIDFVRAAKTVSLLQNFDEGLLPIAMVSPVFRRAKQMADQISSGKLNKVNTTNATTEKSKSSLLGKAKDMWNKIINGTISEEEARKYLVEYYAKNPSVVQNEENSAKALEIIKGNARTLQEASKEVTRVNDLIKKVEQKRGGEPVSVQVREKLTERAALGNFLDRRIAEIEKSITNSEEISSKETSLETYGSIEAANTHRTNLLQGKTELLDTIERQKKKIEEAEKKYNDYVEQFKTEKGEYVLKEEEKKEAMELMASRDSEVQQLNLLEQSLDLVQDKLDTIDKLRENKENSDIGVLSKDEILSLAPEDRARMLDENNLSNYSKAQQKQIREAREELNTRDPELLRDVQDQARLVQRRRANQTAFSMILENPEAAAASLDAEQAVMLDQAVIAYKNREVKGVESLIQNVEKNNKKEHRVARYLHKRFVEMGLKEGVEYLQMLKSSKSEAIKKYSNVLDNAINKVNTHNEVVDSINNLGLEEAQRKRLIETAYNIVEEANSRAEVLDKLEELNNSKEVSDQDKVELFKLHGTLTGLWNQKEALSTMSVAERNAILTREQKKQEQAKEAKTEVAQEEAEKESKKVSTRKANEKAKRILNKKTTQKAIITDKPSKRGRKSIRKIIAKLRSKKSSDIDKINAIIAFENLIYKKVEITQEEADLYAKTVDELAEKGYTWDDLLHTEFIPEKKVSYEVSSMKRDEELPEKAAIITSVQSPTIYKDGKLIQKGKVTVTTKDPKALKERMKEVERRKEERKREKQEQKQTNINNKAEQELRRQGKISSETNVTSSPKARGRKRAYKFMWTLIDENASATDKINALSQLENLMYYGVEFTQAELDAIQDEAKKLRKAGYEIPVLLGTNFKSNDNVKAYTKEDPTLPKGTSLVIKVRRPLIIKGKDVIQKGEVVVVQNTGAKTSSTKTNKTAEEEVVDKELTEDDITNHLYTLLDEEADIKDKLNAIKVLSAFLDRGGELGEEGKTILEDAKEQLKEEIEKAEEEEIVEEETGEDDFDEDFDDDFDDGGEDLSDFTDEEIQAALDGEDIGNNPPIENSPENTDNSPSITEQVNESSETAAIVPVPIRNINNDNAVTSVADQVERVSGNRYPGYEIGPLRNSGEQVPKSTEEGNYYKIYKWLQDAGIRYQDIIDNEIGDIAALNPNVYTMYTYMNANTTNDHYVRDVSFLVVEYTPEIQQIHNEDFGGVITSKGKRYLIIGATLAKGKNLESKYLDQLIADKIARKRFFDTNPAERFFVISTRYTQIDSSSITPGFRVRKRATDDKVEKRSIVEILQDKERNPKGLTIQDLKWLIQKDGDWATVNVSDRNVIYAPSDTKSNVGSVFLLMEAANGNYIPMYIPPLRYEDMNDGVLKQRIDKLFNDITSVKFEDRKAAKNKLRQLLVFSKGGNNIRFGDENDPTVTIQIDGMRGASYNLQSPDFNRESLVQALKDANFRINVTISSLQTDVEALAEAGALMIDLAKLGTSGVLYDVYDTDINGQPIITEAKPNRGSSRGFRENKEAAERKKDSVRLGNITYRKKDGKWYTDTEALVTDPALITQLDYKQIILSRELSPKNTSRGKVYVVSTDAKSPYIIREKGALLEKLSNDEASRVLEEINSKEITNKKQEAAEAELDRIKAEDAAIEEMSEEEYNRFINGEDVEVGGTNNTGRPHVKMGTPPKGTPPRTPSDTPPGTPPRGEDRFAKTDEKIKAHSNNLELREDSQYVDLTTGKPYARVSHIVESDPSVTPMPENSGWTTPSTALGNTIHKFVEDLLNNEAGNPENYNERYPNATNEELNKIAKEVEKLKRRIRNRKLKIVGTELKVSGALKFRMPSRETAMIDVAGSIDLLLRDENGVYEVWDFKTKRGNIKQSDIVKWTFQTSIYSALLEQAFGVKTNNPQIVPWSLIDTSTDDFKYPFPVEEGGSAVYTREGDQLSINGEKYDRLSARLMGNENTKINSKILPSIDFEKLKAQDKKIVQIISEKPNTPQGSTAPIQQKPNTRTNTKPEKVTPVSRPSVTGNADINSVGSKSISELQSSSKKTTATSILKSREGREIRKLLKEKFPDYPVLASEVESFLQSKKISTTNITNIEAWKKEIEDCK